MKLTVDHTEFGFNLSLCNDKGEPFMTIKGCKMVQGQKGFFVSFPAKKTESGKWFNHVWASDNFQRAVIAEYEKTKAAKPAKPADDDVPF